MKTTLPLLAALALLLGTTPANAAKFYKWTDEQGVTHYSADPPPSSAGKASEVKVKSSYPDEGAQKASPQPSQGKKDAAPGQQTGSKADKTEEKKTDTANDSDRYADKCKRLKADLQTIEEHTRVKVTDPATGESRVLSEEEKNTQLDDTQRQIKAYCE